MENNKIQELIASEKQVEMFSAPLGFENEVMIKVNKLNRDRHQFQIRFYKTAFSCAALALVIVLSVSWFNRARYSSVLICYPYNGEQSVELIGDFNQWNKKIAMKLDQKDKLWKTVLKLPGKGIYEYQFVIDNYLFSAGYDPNVIVDKKGNEKAFISI